MINPIKPPASHVVAVQLEGKITSEDVAEVISLIESGLETSPRVNLFFDMSLIEGVQPAAVLNDLAYGIKNIGRTYRFQQVAFITDNATLEKLISWEDWLFKTVEIKCFSSEEKNQALSWIEQRVELPPPGFQHEESESHLVLRVGDEVTGHDIVHMAELLHKRYESHGPIRLVAFTNGVPKLGPGLLYERIRRLNLLNLVSRYAVVGPDSLRLKIKAADTVLSTRIRHFKPEQESEAIAWAIDDSPTVEILPTGRADRFAIRLSGQITSVEVKAFYSELLPHLKGDNSMDVLLEMPYEEGMTFRAMFQTVKLGIQHFSEVTKGVRRLALITDSRFLSKAAELENILIPAVEERPFTFNQRGIALAWLSEGREEPPLLPAPQETKMLPATTE